MLLSPADPLHRYSALYRTASSLSSRRGVSETDERAKQGRKVLSHGIVLLAMVRQ